VLTFAAKRAIQQFSAIITLVVLIIWHTRPRILKNCRILLILCPAMLK
jgi:hypothetical protein